jgi:mRNA-degrading endonuclease RelE of RelBE toxin-antitoxin system
MSASPRFRLSPSSGYKRDVKRLVKRNRALLQVVKDLQDALGNDPYNQSTKLTDVKPGQGQYRIRSGDYRIRYDIFGDEVILYSFSDRKDTYN